MVERRPSVGFASGADSVFIVRLRIVPREIASQPPVWRGTVEHVPSGERRGVMSLLDIVDFIAGFLREAGADPGPR